MVDPDKERRKGDRRKRDQRNETLIRVV
jgi:hypothetical protein